MDENKTINAKDIVENPDIIHTFYNGYIIVRDQSLMNTFTNMVVAINILFEAGWDVLNLSHDSSAYMYALCQNPHAKRKRDHMSE